MTYIRMARDDQHLVGFMLQILPNESDNKAMSWEYVGHLAETLTDEEMLAGDSCAQLEVGFMYEFGCGVKKNPLGISPPFAPMAITQNLWRVAIVIFVRYSRLCHGRTMVSHGGGVRG